MKGEVYQQKGVICQNNRCGIKGAIFKAYQRCDMHGNLITAGLDGLEAIDRRHQHHQHIGIGSVLGLPESGLLGNAT